MSEFKQENLDQPVSKSMDNHTANNNTESFDNHINKKEMKREKYLIFALKDEKFGIPLSVVKEVIGLTKITPVPQVPAFFKGLINLRGKIISVIDLRAKLKNTICEEYKDKQTCIIIVEIDSLVLGVIVDDVSEVVGFSLDQIENKLDIQSTTSKEFITGVAKTAQKELILLLDIGKVINVEEFKALQKLAQQPRAA